MSLENLTAPVFELLTNSDQYPQLSCLDQQSTMDDRPFHKNQAPKRAFENDRRACRGNCIQHCVMTGL